jgi:hypothetical protein
MIDRETGLLDFQEPPVQIGPNLTRTEFLAATWAGDAEDVVVNEPWHSWKLRGKYVAEAVSFIVVLYFHGECLKMIILGNADERFGKSWGDWSLENEMARKASHDQWLTSFLGSWREFPWGGASSEFDSRSGGSSIIIRYEKR